MAGLSQGSVCATIFEVFPAVLACDPRRMPAFRPPCPVFPTAFGRTRMQLWCAASWDSQGAVPSARYAVEMAQAGRVLRRLMYQNTPVRRRV